MQYPASSPLRPSIKLLPLINTAKQKTVKQMLKKLLVNKLFKKFELRLFISKFSPRTNENCKKRKDNIIGVILSTEKIRDNL